MNGREVQSESDCGTVAHSVPGVPQAGRTEVRTPQHAEGARQSQVCGGDAHHASQSSHVSQSVIVIVVVVVMIVNNALFRLGFGW